MTAIESNSASAELHDARCRALTERGVEILDPRQTYIGPEVDLARIEAGVVLHPGSRVTGARTYLAQRAEIGSEGPATVHDCGFAAGSSIASGFASGAVLLEGASAGGQAHLRAGTLLEEQASTAHCVGLKQTILMSFVTLGSLINFCDCLMAGGTSRKDHSEVGSGFIHFNFTPFGEHGDKATPSLIGDVVRGVFLDSPRIFLGGVAGLVGPRRVGFGSVAAAGQVVRKDVPPGRMVLGAPRAIEREFVGGVVDRFESRATQNFEYIAQLVALHAWYREARGARARLGHGSLAITELAQASLAGAVAERCKQFNRFATERGASPISVDVEDVGRGPLADHPDWLEGPSAHVEWVQALAPERREALAVWLSSVARGVVTRLTSL